MHSIAIGSTARILMLYNQMLKMKYCLLIQLFVISLTDAVEVSDEDINSPLVSYLLAKVQRLEAKVIPSPAISRTLEKLIDTNSNADDMKPKDCPQQVVTYVSWGNKTCISIWSLYNL